MKICNVVKDSVWYDPRVRKQVLSYLKTSDCEVNVIGMMDLRYDSDKLKDYPCAVNLVSVPQKYFSKGRTLFTKVKRELYVNRQMTRMIIESNPDIIHANDLNVLGAAYIAAKKLKCRLVYDSHEVFVENLGVVNHRLVQLIWKSYEKFLIKRIDKMVCVSNAAASYFTEIYGIETPMVVTNCSLKEEQCYSEEKHTGFEVLNHGQYYSGRGYDVMIEAIPYLVDYPEIKLALRGFGVMEESLRIRAKELGTDQVRFYPKVLVNELIPMAAKSHVGVAITEPICLNFKLSVSNKLFEYASAGIPVIMSDIPEHRYLNEKYHFGIILSDNKPETFAKAVIEFYKNSGFYEQCAKNARKLSNEINWEDEFKKLIDVERNLVKKI